MQLQKIEPMDPVSAMVFFAGAALFFTLIALLFGSDVAAERRARETLLRDLRSLHPPYRVTVNGLTAAEPAAIVEALKTVAPVKVYVHRKSLDPIELVIRDEARTIRLAVAQDSRLWQQFWVSVPNDSLFRPYGQDAGRVTDWRLAGLLSSSGKN